MTNQSPPSSLYDEPIRSGPVDIFLTTRWTVVLAAGNSQAPQAAAALEELCAAYWYPLYAYVRRHGHSKEDAEDLVQSFFALFLEQNYLENLSSEKGRFRAFLLACFKHFLANQWDRAHRAKRGGSIPHLSLDWRDADSRYASDLADSLSPDKLYDRAWALTLLQRVLDRLRQESAAEPRLFEALKGYLTVEKGAIPYREAASTLAMAEGAVRVTVHRLRRRYRELLLQEVTQTLSQPVQAQEEMRALLAAFSG